jgi:hypothetical protein
MKIETIRIYNYSVNSSPKRDVVLLNPVNVLVLSFVPSTDILILTTVVSNVFFLAVMQCQRH